MRTPTHATPHNPNNNQPPTTQPPHNEPSQVYVFDEPSSGLDYRHLHSTARTIRDLAEADKVVVIVTHDEELLAACADHVVKIQPLTRSL